MRKQRRRSANREADQRLCFRFSDSRVPLLLKSEISSFYLFSVTVQAGLCLTCSDTTLLVFPRGGSYESGGQVHSSQKGACAVWQMKICNFETFQTKRRYDELQLLPKLSARSFLLVRSLQTEQL